MFLCLIVFLLFAFAIFLSYLHSIFESIKFVLSNDRNLDSQYSLKILTTLILVAFVAAFIIHGQQIEAASRLDFLWKLQATGIYSRYFRDYNQPSICHELIN